jgi:serine/threonine protein kinase
MHTDIARLPDLGPTLRLEKRVGDGGMSSVFRGRHERLRRTVAIKIPRTDTDCAGTCDHTRVIDEDSAWQQSIAEYEALKAIRSRRVVRALDHSEPGAPAVWLATEWVEGTSVGEMLRVRGPMTIEEVRRIGVGVADALSAVHTAGVVHADIKPDNILVRESAGRCDVKLIDFGISHVLGSDRAVRRPSGTLGFMSTEQIIGPDRPSGAWDAWALTVMVYGCLIGEAPFKGARLIELICAHQGSRWRRSVKRRGLVRAMPFFEQAFHPVVSKRFQTAREWRERFESMLADEDPSAIWSRTGARTRAAA